MEKLRNAKVDKSQVAVHWLGQGGFAFKNSGGDIIVVDPYLSDSANADGASPRMADIPIRPKDVRLDYLFLTHDHLDHTDPHTAPAISQSNPNARVICPPSSAHHLTRLGVSPTQMDIAMPGDALEYPKFVARAVPAQHTEDSVGFVFEFQSGGSNSDSYVVYLTGDTEYNPGLAQAVDEFGVDLLIVPINGRLGNMSAQEAAQLAMEIEPADVIPMHYGMFESNNADPNAFISHLENLAPLGGQIRPVIMKHNTCRLFSHNESTQGKKEHKLKRSEEAKRARASGEHHDGVRGPHSHRR